MKNVLGVPSSFLGRPCSAVEPLGNVAEANDAHESDVGRDLLRDHVTRAHWTRARYHVKVKILTVFRPGSGLLEDGALYRSGTVDQPS